MPGRWKAFWVVLPLVLLLGVAAWGYSLGHRPDAARVARSAEVGAADGLATALLDRRLADLEQALGPDFSRHATRVDDACRSQRRQLSLRRWFPVGCERLVTVVFGFDLDPVAGGRALDAALRATGWTTPPGAVKATYEDAYRLDAEVVWPSDVGVAPPDPDRAERAESRPIDLAIAVESAQAEQEHAVLVAVRAAYFFDGAVSPVAGEIGEPIYDDCVRPAGDCPNQR